MRNSDTTGRPGTAYLVFFAAAALLGSTAVSAQDSWFAGGSVGVSSQADYDVGVPVASQDDSDTAFRLFGGYLVSPMQGFIASYIDLGTAKYADPAFGGFTDDLSADGIDVSYIIGFAPGDQERINVFGTIGVFAWDQDVRFVDTSGTYEYKDDGTSLSLGIGAEFAWGGRSSPWGLNVSYQHFKDVGDANNSGHEYDRDILSVGANFRFGGRQ